MVLQTSMLGRTICSARRMCSPRYTLRFAASWLLGRRSRLRSSSDVSARVVLHQPKLIHLPGSEGKLCHGVAECTGHTSVNSDVALTGGKGADRSGRVAGFGGGHGVCPFCGAGFARPMFMRPFERRVNSNSLIYKGFCRKLRHLKGDKTRQNCCRNVEDIIRG
jgi:hypothetical protein